MVASTAEFQTVGKPMAVPIYTVDQLGRPVSVSDAWGIRNGAAFVCNGRGVTGAAANITQCSLSLFNPAGSGKTMLIFSLKTLSSNTGGSLHQYNFTTSDPAGAAGYTGTPAIHTLVPKTAAPSVASAAQTATGSTSDIGTLVGTVIEEYIPVQGVTLEILTNGTVLVLPAGNGLAVANFCAANNAYYQCCAKWVEY